MEMYLKHIFPNFILIISIIFAWYKLLNKKIDYKNYKLYVTMIISMISSIINYIIVEKSIRIVIITIIFMLLIRYLFKETIQKCVITAIFYQIIIFLSESMYAIVIAIIIGTDFEKFLNNFYGLVITNFFIGVLSYLIISNSKIKKIYIKLIEVTKKIKNDQLIAFSIILLIILNIFNVPLYYKIKFEYLVIINVFIIILSIVITFYSLNTKNKLNKISDKYNVAITSLKDYEEMMSKYRISNHENKNLLLTLRAMIINGEKDIPKYIDGIVEEKYKDDERLLMKTVSIPTGGLRAAIYSGILKIKNNNIKYDLNIDKNVKSFDLIELESSSIIEICKILGVLIDNAIDETLKNKNGYIGIEIYIYRSNLNIKISNIVNGSIDMEKIFDLGYTTKNKGRGHGLSLVRNIIMNNKYIDIKTEMRNNIFSQNLIIKNYKKRK